MRQDMLKQAAVYHKEHRRKVKRYKIFSALAAAVVFCTTVVLIMPAATMEKPLVCGFEEHVHTEECQGVETEVLVCGLEESEGGGHVHGDECYEMVEVKTLTCGLEESEAAVDHTEEPAHETAKVKTLTCELEETEAVEGHIHDESCYTEEPVYETQTVTVEDTETQEVLNEEGNVVSETVVVGYHEEEIQVQVGTDKVLTCGLEEAEAVEGHTHDESCYTEEPVNETQDVPDEEQEEAAGHTHTDDCYTVEIEKTLVCTEEENQIEGNAHSEEENQIEGNAHSEEEGQIEGNAHSEEEGQIEGHTHSEDCYETKMVYACGLEEHEHTDECRQPPHEHGEDCYTTVKTLICGEEESEEHTHDDSCYTEEQVLTCTEGEEPAEEPQEAAPVELTETVENRYYQTVFHVTYNGEVAEEDVLDFTAATTGSEDMESGRDYEYMFALPEDGKTLPMGRTEFALTLNGEAVDRGSYTVIAEVIPSRESVAFLAMAQGGGMGNMTLDLYDDDCCGESVGTVPGFTLYELVNGELAGMGRTAVNLENLDLDSYMADAYDEDGSPTYDEAYTVWAVVQGEDFLITAGVEEEIIDPLATSMSYYNGENYVVWEGYTSTVSYSNTWLWETGWNQNSACNDGHPSYSTHSNCSSYNSATRSCKHGYYKKVESDFKHAEAAIGENGVKITHASSTGVKNGVTYTINHAGTGDTPINSQTKANNLMKTSGLQLKDIFPNARKASSYTSGTLDYALLEITPNPGFYVTKIYITCIQATRPGYVGVSKYDNIKNPYKCSNLTGGTAYWKEFDVSEGTSVSLKLDSEAFGHGDDELFLVVLIQTAPVPAPLFVQYETGSIGETGITSENAIFSNFTGTVDANGTKSWLTTDGRSTGNNNVQHSTTRKADKLTKTAGGNWATGDLLYTTAAISPEAETAANAVGYTFAGWKVEYYETANRNGSEVKDDIDQDQIDDVTLAAAANRGALVAGNTPINLQMHAKLIAQWKTIPAIAVTKTVQNWTPGTGESADTPHEFTFQVEKLNTETGKWDAVTFTHSVLNSETNSWQSVSTGPTFTLSPRGNRTTVPYQIEGLATGTYRVVEVGEYDGVTGTTYSHNGGASSKDIPTFDIVFESSKYEMLHRVAITNDYTSAPTAFNLTVQKVVGEKDSAGNPTTVTANMAALPGATFQLYRQNDVDAETGEPNWVEVGTLSPNGLSGTGTAGTASIAELEFGTYKLVETEAPAGYNKLADEIIFTVGADTAEINLDVENTTAIGSVTVNDDDHTMTVTLTVANYGGYVLPSTGGPGTTLYTLGSMLFMLAAAFLMYKNLRERRRAVA